MENKRKTSINQPGKPTNMWQEILREAMPKKEIENTNVFVFGDKMTGKRALFKVMNRSIFENDDSCNESIVDIAKEIICFLDNLKNFSCYNNRIFLQKNSSF